MTLNLIGISKHQYITHNIFTKNNNKNNTFSKIHITQKINEFKQLSVYAGFYSIIYIVEVHTAQLVF